MNGSHALVPCICLWEAVNSCGVLRVWKAGEYTEKLEEMGRGLMMAVADGAIFINNSI